MMSKERGVYTNNNKHRTLLIVDRKFPELPLLGPLYHVMESMMIEKIQIFSFLFLIPNPRFQQWHCVCNQEIHSDNNTTKPAYGG